MAISNTLVGRVFTDDQGNTRINLLDDAMLSKISDNAGLNKFAPVICEDSLSYRTPLLAIYNLFILCVNTFLYRKWERVNIKENSQDPGRFVWINLYSLERRMNHEHYALGVNTLLRFKDEANLGTCINYHLETVKRVLSEMEEQQNVELTDENLSAKSPKKTRVLPNRSTGAKSSFAAKEEMEAKVREKLAKAKDLDDVALNDVVKDYEGQDVFYRTGLCLRLKEDHEALEQASKHFLGDLSWKEVKKLADGEVILTPVIAKAYLADICRIEQGNEDTDYKQVKRATKAYLAHLQKIIATQPKYKAAAQAAVEVVQTLAHKIEHKAKEYEKEGFNHQAWGMQSLFNKICESDLTQEELAVLLSSKYNARSSRYFKILDKLCEGRGTYERINEKLTRLNDKIPELKETYKDCPEIGEVTDLISRLYLFN